MFCPSAIVGLYRKSWFRVAGLRTFKNTGKMTLSVSLPFCWNFHGYLRSFLLLVSFFCLHHSGILSILGGGLPHFQQSCSWGWLSIALLFTGVLIWTVHVHTSMVGAITIFYSLYKRILSAHPRQKINLREEAFVRFMAVWFSSLFSLIWKYIICYFSLIVWERPLPENQILTILWSEILA